ncbi:MAG: tetratricopeptide repeat protein [Planctomycetota bacterium]|jgi:tetratricopeptide (TPR) repeat protein
MRRQAVSCLLLAAACSTPQGRARRLRELPDESRYHAARRERDLRVLRRVIRDADPLTRNAIARALCERGDPGSAWILIVNLHRDQRTFVCTDAIYHLRAVFGDDKGYNPNRGYRHQTRKQREWWDWFAKQPFGVPAPELEPAEAIDLEPWRRTDWTHDEILERWEELAPLAGSRRPEHVHLVCVAFEGFAAAWPEHPDLWNNLALAALNDGDYELSERAYRRALRLKPKDANLQNDLGILLEGLGRLEEAALHYREAGRLAPEDDICRSNLADVLAALGRTEEAVASYRAAERLAPEKWYYHRLWIRRLESR